MDLSKYITSNTAILIPALYVIGMIIKNTEKIPDKFIPSVLLVFGIIGSVFIMGININAIIQGILATGMAVYSNQLIKQSCKKE